MKVLQILEPIGMGGVEKIALDLHNYISTYNNVESYIAISQSYIDMFKESYDAKNLKNILPIDDSNFIKKIKSYRNIIKYINPDIIHTHARKECVLSCILKKDKYHIRTQHMEEYNRIPKTFIEKNLIRKKVDKWICTSNTLKNNYLLNQGINNLKCDVIYNGIENNITDINKNYYKSNQRKLELGFVGRLNKQKGLDILIDDISCLDKTILDKLQLTIVGDGEDKSELIKKVNQCNMNDTIKFLGFQKNVIEIMNKFDILVMPSRSEGLPLAMLESMSRGTPVAVHDVGCISEIIENGNNGWIINRSNNSWSNFIRHVLDEKYNIDKISIKSYETYKRKFTLERMCKEYYEMYNNSLLKEKKMW